MAQLITTDGKMTTVTPAHNVHNIFTREELEGCVGGSLDIFELPGSLYAVTIHKAKEIGAEENKAARAGYVIHMAHLEVEGKLPLDQTSNPPPQFYGTVLFCKREELEELGELETEAEPAYTGRDGGSDHNEERSQEV